MPVDASYAVVVHNYACYECRLWLPIYFLSEFAGAEPLPRERGLKKSRMGSRRQPFLNKEPDLKRQHPIYSASPPVPPPPPA